ncbi:MAG: N-acetyltransferase [Spirosoma sp.]|nr:N-acetyltransferase [Spirosoma sp.]
MTIRAATSADASAMLAIYAPFVLNTTFSFEYTVPTVAGFAQRIETIRERFPYLVAEQDGRIMGYAYASAHRDRAAYQWSVDTSVYIHPDAHRQGMARQLYTTLFDLLRRQGMYNVYAGITLPNPASEAFHRSMGFRPVGVYENVGFKFGAWHSATWLQMALQPHEPDPVPPMLFSDLPK